MTETKKLTFKELMEKHPLKCQCCEKVLDWSLTSFVNREFNKLTDVDGERLKGFYCGDCYEYSQAKVMNERFVEIYNHNTIYLKNGRYMPYWGFGYYFNTLEECRMWIDHRVRKIEKAKKDWEHRRM